MSLLEPIRLEPAWHEKVWGSTRLEPWFPNPPSRIGELWFSHDGARTPLGLSLRELMDRHGADLLGTCVSPGAGGRFPILTKFLFTSEKLSVQVHPEDEYAWRHAASPGKTEMWHILRADPGASIAVGFRRTVTASEVRRAAEAGDIEHLLSWIEVQAGETYFIPAGTVHALGAGLALCEIQQNSDVTYRLYDYGRPRPLHLDRALEVATLGTHPGRARPQDGLLVRCPYFETRLRVPREPFLCQPSAERFHLLVVLEGSGRMGAQPFRAGEVWLVPAAARGFEVVPHGSARLLDCCVP